MSCTLSKENLINGCGESTLKQSKFTFKDGLCYKDGSKYGKVVYSDSELITVEVDNGNKYMKGQIVDFKINAT